MKTKMSITLITTPAKIEVDGYDLLLTKMGYINKKWVPAFLNSIQDPNIKNYLADNYDSKTFITLYTKWVKETLTLTTTPLRNQ